MLSRVHDGLMVNIQPPRESPGLRSFILRGSLFWVTIAEQTICLMVFLSFSGIATSMRIFVLTVSNSDIVSEVCRLERPS